MSNFTPEVLAQLSGFYNSSIIFQGTDESDVFNLEGLDGVIEDGSLNHLEYVLTEGTDTIIFPEGGQDYNYELGSGTIASDKLFQDEFFSNYQNGVIDFGNYSFTGVTYQFNTPTDVTITSTTHAGVSSFTTAENVYKIFDSPYTDDYLYGTEGSQQFRSEGGWDTVYGGPGSDVFRVDGSRLTADWADPDVYKAIGHKLIITDYELGERISIEDFGLTNSSDIWSEIDPSGYTNIYIDGLIDITFRELSANPGGGQELSPYTVDINNTELVFNDLHGNTHVVAALNDSGQSRFGSIMPDSNVTSIGNGNYLIAYSVRDDSGGAVGSDIYFSIFNTEMNYFTSEEVYLGTSNSTVESINVEFHENGRAVISPHSPSSDGFVAEVRADEYGYYYDYAFNNIYNAGSPNSQNSIYTVSRPQHDEYGNWVGDRADIVFTDRYGDQHVVAAHSDLAAGQRFGNLQESNASSLGNGHYLIAYSVRDDSGTTGSDIYYRVFDTSTSSFTSGKKLLGSTENFTVEAINVELHEEGRVVLSVEPPSANGFTAEIRQDSDYYYLDHTFRQISSSPGNNEKAAYTLSRSEFDENGAAISHDQADIIFTDLHGVSHVVADYSEMAAGSNVRFGNTDMNSVGSMGNGNYLIAFTVRNDSGPDRH